MTLALAKCQRAMCCILVGLLGCVSLRAEEQPTVRRYDAGPLTAADFQAATPKPLPSVGRTRQLAFTDTDIHFQMRYRYRDVDEHVEAKLTAVQVFAVFLCDKSWLSEENAKLLDHEQGHFDVTQIYALQTQLHLQQQMGEGKTLIGRGESVRAAIQDLEAQMNDVLKPTYERAAVAQQQYDRTTQHGLLAAQQASHRKRQLELLKELTTDLAALQSDD